MGNVYTSEANFTSHLTLTHLTHTSDQIWLTLVFSSPSLHPFFSRPQRMLFLAALRWMGFGVFLLAHASSEPQILHFIPGMDLALAHIPPSRDTLVSSRTRAVALHITLRKFTSSSVRSVSDVEILKAAVLCTVSCVVCCVVCPVFGEYWNIY